MDTTQTGDKESAVFITQKCTVNLHVCESIIDLLPTFCSHIGILLLLNPCPEEPIKQFHKSDDKHQLQTCILHSSVHLHKDLFFSL